MQPAARGQHGALKTSQWDCNGEREPIDRLGGCETVVNKSRLLKKVHKGTELKRKDVRATS